MPKGMRDDSLTQDEAFLDDGGDWLEDALDDSVQTERVKAVPRSGPKWKAIEDYWEQKRLRDALQDYLTEENGAITRQRNMPHHPNPPGGRGNEDDLL